MKKNVISIMLNLAIVTGSISAAPVHAVERDVQAEEAVHAEEEAAQEENADVQGVPEQDGNAAVSGGDEENPAAGETMADSASTGESAEESAASEIEEPPVTEEAPEIKETPETEETSAIEEAPEIKETPVTEETSVIEEALETAEDKTALAGEVIGSGKCGQNATWKLTGTGDDLTLTISGSGKMQDYESPDYAGNENLAPWGTGKEIKKLVIGEGITTVGEHAFYELSGLQQVSLPDTLTKIKKWSFEKCGALNDITIPESVTSIEYQAFAYCSSLRNIKFPKNSMSCLGTLAFCYCSSLTSVVLPRSVEVIEASAFEHCTGLKSAVFPDNLGSASSGIFAGCSSLASVVLPKKMTSSKGRMFFGCSSLASIVIPDSWSSIKASFFSGCSGLKSIVIPNSVTKIESDAFADCVNLTSIVIPNSVSSIGPYTFTGCTGLKSITLPKDLKYLGWHAFRGSGLTSIVVPDNVTTIEQSTFQDCSSLASVSLPKSLKTIESAAFYGTGLTSITIPDNVSSISIDAFTESKKLTRIITGAGNRTYSSKDGVLFNKDRTKLLLCPKGKAGMYVVPSGTRSIETDAFTNCKKLTGIEFPKSLETIRDFVILECTGIRTITIPDKDTAVGSYAFLLDKIVIWGDEYSSYDTPVIESTIKPEYVMYLVKGSKAESYARENRISYVYICDSHIWNKKYTIDKEASCILAGSESIHCSVCGQINGSTVRSIPKKDHTYGEWTVTKEATETGRGIKERKCTVCGRKESSKIPALAPLPIEEQEISGIEDGTFRWYTGEARVLNIEITCDGDLLTEGKDYTVSYKNNTGLGEATAIITGKGEFKGTVEKKFPILLGSTAKVTCTNVASGIKVGWDKVPGATSYYVYRGDRFLFRTSALAVTDKEVKYNGGTKYVYKVLATAKGSGDSPKARTAAMYRLMPVGIKSVTNPSAGRMTVTYDKSKGCYGYVVRYGLKKDMSDANVVTVKGENTLSRTFSGMKKGRTYYVQVRTYMLENGARYYSGYCTTKTITITK